MPLDGQTLPESGRNRNLRQEICPHVAVKVWQRALEICWECSSLCYTPIQCQSTTILASLHLWGATWWPNVAWKWQKSESEARNLPPCGCKSMTEGPRNMLGVFITLLYTYTMPINYYSSKPTSLRCHLMAKRCLKVSRNRNLRQEICPHVAVKVWQRALEICWECSSLCYTLIQCQSTTILASLHLWGATWWPNVGWKWQKSESEARNLPPCGCKSMTEGPRNMLGVFITLLYTYTMPINYYSSKPTSLRCHLMAKRCLKVAEIGIWGKKSAPMWL